MFYLIAGFICSALVSIVLKISDRKEYDRYGMLAVNYLTCLIPFLISQRNKSFPSFDSDFIFCLLLALINGAMYLAGMAINQMNVKRNGAVLQASFARLGVMVPTCLAIVFFGERPSLLQAAGIIIVLAAFCIMNIREKNEDEKGSERRKMRPPEPFFSFCTQLRDFVLSPMPSLLDEKTIRRWNASHV